MNGALRVRSRRHDAKSADWNSLSPYAANFEGTLS
jgi:hypothetical protein